MIDLNEHQVGYVTSLVRMDLRKKERALAKAARKPDQRVDEFDEFVVHLRNNIEFRRGTLAALGKAER